MKTCSKVADFASCAAGPVGVSVSFDNNASIFVENKLVYTFYGQNRPNLLLASLTHTFWRRDSDCDGHFPVHDSAERRDAGGAQRQGLPQQRQRPVSVAFLFV